jgi:hypothetical protein
MRAEQLYTHTALVNSVHGQGAGRNNQSSASRTQIICPFIIVESLRSHLGNGFHAQVGTLGPSRLPAFALSTGTALAFGNFCRDAGRGRPRSRSATTQALARLTQVRCQARLITGWHLSEQRRVQLRLGGGGAWGVPRAAPSRRPVQGAIQAMPSLTSPDSLSRRSSGLRPLWFLPAASTCHRWGPGSPYASPVQPRAPTMAGPSKPSPK